ncbi:MAG: chromate transporter [Sedimentibacter sp.]|uniref:chromate transporter n=1 Tax=Sedimentibacter sp. TaxID=1960295 RepID=UPI003158303E
MMIYLNLLFSFIKIGLFSYGGGYAMIPLIQREIENHGWISHTEFVDIIAIAEMTPGPIAVNSATFVGYKAAGLLGSIIATLGVALPSLILIILVSGFFFKIQKKPINIMVFYGVRPVITGLIAAAGIFVAETAIFNKIISLETFGNFLSNPVNYFDFGGIIIMLISFIALAKLKANPIFTIAGAGVAGIVIYFFIPLI